MHVPLQSIVILAVVCCGSALPGADQREPDAATAAWMAENMVVVEQVRPNTLAIQRLNAERAATGLPPLDLRPVADDADIIGRTQAQKAATAAARVAAAASPSNSALPRSVDNTATPWFPPIKHQGGIGSCVAFSSVYYTMTYTVARARGIDVVGEGARAWRSPRFINNLISSGTNNGSIIPLAYGAMLNHGAPSWESWPYYSEFLIWPTSAAIWREAIPYRLSSSGTVLTDTDSNQLLMKQLLANGYVLNYATDIFGWQWARLGDDPSTTADNAFVGQHVVPWCKIDSSGHGMTLVGYNDDLWFDLNGNGQVEAAEKGAVKIANSWGWWQNSGCAWVTYDALRTISAVPGWTGENRTRCFWSGLAYYMTARPEHVPTVLAEFTVNTAQRNQVSMRHGVSPATATTPTRFLNTVLMRAGGAYAFDGTTTAVDGTFVLDLTDAQIDGAGRYYVQVQDHAAGNTTTVRNLRLTDAAGTTLATVGGTSPAGGMPQEVDNATLLAWADLDMRDNTAPAAIQDLAIARSQPTSTSLQFTAPGDDGRTGQSKSYDLRYSRSPISEGTWASATQATGEPAPGISGSRQGATLNALGSGIWYLAMKAIDDAGNQSPISNVVEVDVPLVLQLTGAVELPTGTSGTAYATTLTATGGTGGRVWTSFDGPYETDPGSSGTAITGTAQGWRADNGSWPYTFPGGFVFPFAGTDRTQVRVSSDGYLEFGSTIDRGDLVRDPAFRAAAMIAVAWEDMSTAGSGATGEDIYIEETADAVTIRWLAERTLNPAVIIDCQATLHRAGSIAMRWNRSSSGSTPFKGVSYGDGQRWARSGLNLAAPVAGQHRIWRQLGWPAGLVLDPDSGVLSGTPISAGSTWLGITVTDAGLPPQTASGIRFLRVHAPDAGNQPPSANAQTIVVTEDVARQVVLTGSDPEGATLSFAIAAPPTKGVLSGSGATRTYTPNANATGADSFTFTVSDGTLTSAAATVSIAITAVNDAPLAHAQSVTTSAGRPCSIQLAGSDADGDTLTFALATSPPAAEGAVVLAGSVATFTPAAGWSGRSGFSFTVHDGAVRSTPADVGVLVDAAPAELRQVQVRLGGTVDPGTVELRIDGRAVELDGEGRWSVLIEVPVGATAVQLQAVDRAGNVTARPLQLTRGAGG